MTIQECDTMRRKYAEKSLNCLHGDKRAGDVATWGYYKRKYDFYNQLYKDLMEIKNITT